MADLNFQGDYLPPSGGLVLLDINGSADLNTKLGRLVASSVSSLQGVPAASVSSGKALTTTLSTISATGSTAIGGRAGLVTGSIVQAATSKAVSAKTSLVADSGIIGAESTILLLVSSEGFLECTPSLISSGKVLQSSTASLDTIVVKESSGRTSLNSSSDLIGNTFSLFEEEIRLYGTTNLNLRPVRVLQSAIGLTGPAEFNARALRTTEGIVVLSSGSGFLLTSGNLYTGKTLHSSSSSLVGLATVQALTSASVYSVTSLSAKVATTKSTSSTLPITSTISTRPTKIQSPGLRLSGISDLNLRGSTTLNGTIVAAGGSTLLGRGSGDFTFKASLSGDGRLVGSEGIKIWKVCSEITSENNRDSLSRIGDNISIIKLYITSTDISRQINSSEVC